MTAEQKLPALLRWSRRIAVLAATAWAGSLWGVGFLAVPVLFKTLPDKMEAGLLAGRMFSLVACVGIACAAYLLLQLAAEFRGRAFRQPQFLLVAAMLLLVLAGQFGLQPEMADLKALALPDDVMHSPFADRFDLLHKIATALYVAQSLLAIPLVLKPRHC